MKPIPGKALLAILLGLILLSACARLPEYARPRVRPIAEVSTVPVIGFSYRQLTLEDFQAPSLPQEFRQHNHQIQAQACLSIRPTRNTSIRITRGNIDNMQIYTGRYLEISFEALFNPDCSWWNPSIPPQRQEYILEHEQIHFALTELQARRLNRLHRQFLLDYISVGSTLEEARQELADEVQKVLQQGMRESLETHTRFEEDTSMVYDPEKQREWLIKVTRQLAEEQSTK